ncbi:MAG: sulfotransferase [Thermoplasmatota archaeon]
MIDKEKHYTLFKRMKTNQLLDSMIFYGSQKKWVLETLRFKYFLWIKKKKHRSDKSVVILGGCPRSGTTLLRSLLGMHPAIASPKQEYNLLAFNDNYDLLKKSFQFSEKEIDKLLEINDHILYSEKIIDLYQHKTNSNLVALKHPYHIAIIDEIFRFFPHAFFIHIIRDGRDVSCSLRTHPKRKMQNGKIMPINTNNPFKWCVHRWISSINQGKKWRHSPHYLEIHYEDLVNHTTVTMGKIFDFLQLNMIEKKKLLDFYKFEQSTSHLQNIEVGTQLYQKSIGRWKKDMTEKEKKQFKNLAGRLLIELGYEKNTDW